MPKKFRDIEEQDKPREKILKKGAKSLSDKDFISSNYKYWK